MIKLANDAAREIANILGIPVAGIAKVNIELIAGDVARAHVEFILTKEQWSRIGQIEQAGIDK